jgi:hypothetical protein
LRAVIVVAGSLGVSSLALISMVWHLANKQPREWKFANSPKKKPANSLSSRAFIWLRGLDLNQRPSGYERRTNRERKTRESNHLRHKRLKSLNFFAAFSGIQPHSAAPAG